MFGHGLSKGADIDGNSFNDFAIGAPNAEMVFLYRAYPVVKILSRINLNQTEISIEQTQLKFEVCYSIAESLQKAHLKMKVIVDPIIKRASILKLFNQGFEMEFMDLADQNEKCKNFVCDIRRSYADIFMPIEVEFKYELQNKIPDSSEFCRECLAVDPLDAMHTKVKIPFITGCQQNICVADLSVKSSGLR